MEVEHKVVSWYSFFLSSWNGKFSDEGGGGDVGGDPHLPP